MDSPDADSSVLRPATSPELPPGWGTSAAEFRWAVGIENTFVPQARAGHRRFDEYELMDHYRLWRGDLDRAADLGISTIRYGIPWYKVNPEPGVYDWSWTDPVLEYLVATKGLDPIIDLVHFGTPLWLDNGFVNASYPRLVAEFAWRFADRYASLVRCYTPANEPAVTAKFCGRDGRWPPYLRGDDGFAKVILAVTRGINLTAEAIRAARPDAILVHAEDVGMETSKDQALADLAGDRQDRRLLPLDLACGRVVPGHPLFGWLMEHGAAEGALLEIAASTPRWDLLGVNYYPWSSRRLTRRRDGRVREVSEPDPSILEDVLRMMHDRYGLPLMVTETSAPGSHHDRANWMQGTLSAVRQARGDGVPVVGYTWFPLFTMIEWHYRWSRKPIAEHLLHLGLLDVPMTDGRMDREPTPLVESFREAIEFPASTLGEYDPSPYLVA